MAGRSFALACAAAGFHVALEDVMPANLRRANVDEECCRMSLTWYTFCIYLRSGNCLSEICVVDSGEGTSEYCHARLA